MTDTPRTKAELLALFANNTTHDISPQDMRDFVVSAMSPQMVSAQDYSAAQSFADADTFYPLEVNNPDPYDDPFALVQATPYVSGWYGATWPAGSWVSLDVGVWEVWSFAAFHQTLAGSVGNSVYPDILIDPASASHSLVMYRGWTVYHAAGAGCVVYGSSMVTCMQDNVPIGGVVTVDTAASRPATSLSAAISATRVR